MIRAMSYRWETLGAEEHEQIEQKEDETTADASGPQRHQFADHERG